MADVTRMLGAGDVLDFFFVCVCCAGPPCMEPVATFFSPFV